MEATALPTAFSTDVDIQAQVTNAILQLDALRAAPAEVNVSVSNGQATLTGIVPSRMMAAEAERVARRVPGVVRVVNQLLDDGTLAREVARTLATDLRTRSIPPGYRVISVLGHITLVGKFSDEQMSDAAVEVAQGVNGVRSANVVSLD